MSPMDFPDDDVSPALSRFIAGLIGPVLAAIACTLLINRELAPEIVSEIAHSKGLIVVSGAMLLVAGLALVQCHATWRGWPAIVTALGWLSVISGLIRILFPIQLASMAPDLMNHATIMVAALICLGLGAYLSAKAYL
jgi:hypothetical protein